MSGAQEGHKAKYKNAGLDAQELRRRREEEGVQIRKNKREQQLFKRRNVFDEASALQVRNLLTFCFLVKRLQTRVTKKALSWSSWRNLMENVPR